MNILLDTHVALWLLQDDRSLGRSATDAIREADGVRVSVASIWEITIKHSIGKLGPPEPVVEALAAAGVDIIDISTSHVLAVANSLLEHQDPFDRLITAQAQAEGSTLFTADAKILSAQLPFIVDARR